MTFFKFNLRLVKNQPVKESEPSYGSESFGKAAKRICKPYYKQFDIAVS